MHSDLDLVGSSRKRYKSWLVPAAVGFIAMLVGYAVAYALGCSTFCTMGRSPLTFGLLLGAAAAIAAVTGMRKN